MAESNGAETIPQTITLPSRPSCIDCVKWGDELIAVAGGEVVHFVDVTGSKPAIESVRVNEFDPADMIIDLPPQTEFSIGREQAVASVVALAWSSSGLGAHHRPVLAVLTSSHHLAFWEHTGKSTPWTRSFIINGNLQASHKDSTPRSEVLIYAFAFLPTFKSPKTQRLEHCIAILDSKGFLWICRLSRNAASSETPWRVDILYQEHLSKVLETADQSQMNAAAALDLFAFDRIEIENWKSLYDENGTLTMLRLSMTFDSQSYRPSPKGNPCLRMEIELEADRYIVSANAAGFVAPDPAVIGPEDFADSLTVPTLRFDKEYEMQGHYAVRWWGFAASPDDSMLAACISVHPSAAPEHIQPRHEKSTLLLVPTGQSQKIEPSTSSDEALRRILHSTLRLAAERAATTETDAKTLHLAATAIQSRFSSDETLLEWSNELLSSIPAEKPMEICKVCTGDKINAISFPDDQILGLCDAGHRFSRCGITFISIQSPGVSKYCSKCGRPFLRVEKLEPPNDEGGQSLTRAVLEQWDLCPYCQGYFRD